MDNKELPSSVIPKVYDPKSIENHWAKYWIDEHLFEPDPASKKPPFVIVIPPPNVTGSLHMGHALNNSLQDILTRWKKMSGFDTLWVPGTDHGGIATQNVVEKLLKQEKKSRHDLGREKFLERMWQWRKESGDTILNQLKRLGCSLDWSRTRFTMDEVCSSAVMMAFSELFKKGWIYRGKRMVNWCVRCHTALSDIEVEYEPRKSKLYYIKYPILSGVKDGWQGVPLIVATTRPETMLGDTAVAVNPDDERYEKIHGWWVQLPLVDREIAVIKDSDVDPKFGTGVVKVTPAHDPVDFAMGEKHNLSHEVVIGFDGKMTKAAGKYAGLSREEARKKVLEDLEAQKLIEKIEDYSHSVGTCYRCGTIVEPLVSDQWFLSVGEMSKTAGQVVRDGQVKIYPDSWSKPYLNWVDNLKDWCISRQIWWGHRIPIWYCIDSKKEKSTDSGIITHPSQKSSCPPFFAKDNPKECPKCKGKTLEQDPDVLDTWFSSALWPFSVFRWPEVTPDLKKYYPTTVLVTGHEILYLWVARMIMFGLTFDPNQAKDVQKKIPYSQVFIHGIVRDKRGKKMSKSLGNVIDPLVMMEKYGTDALRFVLAVQSVPGRDMQISDDTFVGARNFANKIWNVSRFVFMYMTQWTEKDSSWKNQSFEEIQKALKSQKDSLELCDRWILSRFNATTKVVQDALNDYNLALAAREMYHFIWNEFCDWYVELAKIRLLAKEEQNGSKSRVTVLNVLKTLLSGILRLLHPIMPFITEELWKNLGDAKSKSLLLEKYPEIDSSWVDSKSEDNMKVLMSVIGEIRVIRAEMNVPPGEKMKMSFSIPDKTKESFFKEYSHYVQHLCRASSLEIGSKLSKPKKSASAVASGIQIYIPLENLINFDKEKQRIQKELTNIENELKRLDARLSNPDFKKNAPKEEVTRAEGRKTESLQKVTRLKEHMATLDE